jgi:hypothetical protein
MNKKLLQGNFQNKSDLIRRVYEKHPTATNRQIKRIVQQLYGIEVNSNLPPQQNLWVHFGSGRFPIT